MKSVLKKIINTIVDVIVILILAVSVLTVVLSLTSKSSGVPNVFGISPMSVESDSMADTIHKGDLIFCKVLQDDSYEFKAGDIVTFPIEIQNVKTFNTHRIVEVIEDDRITYYKTQGDNEKTNPVPDEELQTASSIVAVYTGTKIPGIGTFFSFIGTQFGFFICILLPMLLFFVYEAVRVVVNIVAYNKEKAIAEANEAVMSAELTEEQKQRAIAEYLASIEQNSDIENK